MTAAERWRKLTGRDLAGCGTKLIGVVQPWEGTPFRRAVHLIWQLTARLKPCPSTTVPIPAFSGNPLVLCPSERIFVRAHLRLGHDLGRGAKKLHESEGARATLK